MRPILRGKNPHSEDYEDYRDAFGDLVSRIGQYCSYCERRIPTNLAVEHIQPKKGPHAFPHLQGRWENFLLGCVNCNSTKGDKKVVLKDLLLPDRDNTGAAYEYTMDGKILVVETLSQRQQEQATQTLVLTGLDKRASRVTDSNGRLVAIDRVRQRMEIRLIAQSSKDDLKSNPNDAFRRQIARTAIGHGFFSIWMAVFYDDVMVRRLLIQEFKGTAADCYDPNTTAVASPRPGNGLPSGGKI